MHRVVVCLKEAIPKTGEGEVVEAVELGQLPGGLEEKRCGRTSCKHCMGGLVEEGGEAVSVSAELADR